MSVTRIPGLCLALAVCLAGGLPALAESELDPAVTAISDNCEAAYEFYQGRFKPMIFVRAEDGSVCTYNYCESACKGTDMRARVLYRCQRESGVPCRITAVFGKPVAGAGEMQ